MESNERSIRLDRVRKTLPSAAVDDISHVKRRDAGPGRGWRLFRDVPQSAACNTYGAVYATLPWAHEDRLGERDLQL